MIAIRAIAIVLNNMTVMIILERIIIVIRAIIIGIHSNKNYEVCDTAHS